MAVWPILLIFGAAVVATPHAAMFDPLPINCEPKALKASKMTSLMRLGSGMLNTRDTF